MARFGNANIVLYCKFYYYYYYIEFECVFLYVWNGMLCTKYTIVFSLEENFPIVLSGEVYCPHRWLRHYTSPDNSIGEQFLQE